MKQSGNIKFFGFLESAGNRDTHPNPQPMDVNIQICGNKGFKFRRQLDIRKTHINPRRRHIDPF
jgi:hypothetical protein